MRERAVSYYFKIAYSKRWLRMSVDDSKDYSGEVIGGILLVMALYLCLKKSYLLFCSAEVESISTPASRDQGERSTLAEVKVDIVDGAQDSPAHSGHSYFDPTVTPKYVASDEGARNCVAKKLEFAS